MKRTYCLPETLGYTQAGVAETDDVMRTGRPADSIRARGANTIPHDDAE
jgi:hypothetical protein